MRLFALILALALALPGQKDLGKTPSDDEIYDTVRRKLANDVDVKGAALEVSVENGVVRLRGTVDKEKGRQKAERLAGKTAGVKKVINELRLKTS